MTLLDCAMRLVGEIEERPGAANHPFIVWCHGATTLGESPDEVPWCSSFVNRLAWLFRLPRSKSAAARSWLTVAVSITLAEAVPGWDIVIFERGSNPAAGHVAIFAGRDGSGVRVVGGNQSNGVTFATYPVAQVIGVRRLRNP